MNTEIHESPYLTLGSALINAGRKWRREINRALQHHGLSQTMVLPLIVLHRSGGTVRQGLIAEEIGVEGPSLVRVIDSLESDGLVERVPDPRDRRAKMVVLTRAGAAKAVEFEEILTAVRERLTANIDAEELATTMRVMQALLAAMTSDERDA